MTLEEIKCFCEEKGATVQVKSPLGTITCSPEGIEMGTTVFAWHGDPRPPLAPQQEILENAHKFIIQPKFGAEIEVDRPKFEELLKT